ncbi:MAG: PEP-CTERM sorting domain-containing protein [Planctomycetaceae bacterium]|nr:PEP-CTERM sorting domain-containing protein [Planctomycetaceae bacterium]
MRGLIAVAVMLTVVGGAQGGAYLMITDFHTTGVLDEQGTQANAIDLEAAGNVKTLAQFKQDVATAFNNGLGGVITFDDPMGYMNDSGPKVIGYGTAGSGRGYNFTGGAGLNNSNYMDEPLKALYGVSQDKTLQIGVARCLEAWTLGASYVGVSGPSVLNPSVNGGATSSASGACMTPETNYWSGDNSKETLSFGAGVVELSFVLLSATQNVNVWVKYADGSLGDVRTITQTAGEDVFVHFAGTAGNNIVEMTWDSDVARPAIDDMAFLMTGWDTVPEPATMSLMAMGGLAALIRRRKA